MWVEFSASAGESFTITCGDVQADGGGEATLGCARRAKRHEEVEEVEKLHDPISVQVAGARGGA